MTDRCCRWQLDDFRYRSSPPNPLPIVSASTRSLLPRIHPSVTHTEHLLNNIVKRLYIQNMCVMCSMRCAVIMRCAVPRIPLSIKLANIRKVTEMGGLWRKSLLLVAKESRERLTVATIESQQQWWIWTHFVHRRKGEELCRTWAYVEWLSIVLYALRFMPSTGKKWFFSCQSLVDFRVFLCISDADVVVAFIVRGSLFSLRVLAILPLCATGKQWSNFVHAKNIPPTYYIYYRCAMPCVRLATVRPMSSIYILDPADACTRQQQNPEQKMYQIEITK